MRPFDRPALLHPAGCGTPTLGGHPPPSQSFTKKDIKDLILQYLKPSPGKGALRSPCLKILPEHILVRHSRFLKIQKKIMPSPQVGMNPTGRHRPGGYSLSCQGIFPRVTAEGESPHPPPAVEAADRKASPAPHRDGRGWEMGSVAGGCGRDGDPRGATGPWLPAGGATPPGPRPHPPGPPGGGER